MEDESHKIEGNAISTQTESEMSAHIAPVVRSWAFDSNDFKKTEVKSSSCPKTGEIADFDVIRREGFDDIMQSVANDDGKNVEDFARSLLDALETVSTLTPGWYV